MSTPNDQLDECSKAPNGRIVPWGGQLTEFVPPEPSWGTVRGLATALAICGSPFAVLVLFFPPFWPGYLVWGGWIAIACGFHGAHNKWFWSASAAWNLGVMMYFYRPGINPLVLTFLHSFATITVSLAMVLLLFTSQRSR